MKDKTGMALVYLGDKCFLVDVKAYYLICSLQQVKFNFEDDEDDWETKASSEEKKRMFQLTLDWMIDNGKAVQLERKPTCLHIKLDGY